MSGTRTIVLLISVTDILPSLAPMLDSMGMLTNEYVYFLSWELIMTDSVEQLFGQQVAGSPLDRLLSGALIFDRLDGFRLRDSSDSFLQAWQAQNSSFVDRLNAMYPLTSSQPGYFQGEADYFQTTDPTNYASYVYDAVIATGLGGCRQGNSTGTVALSSSGVPISNDGTPLGQNQSFSANQSAAASSQPMGGGLPQTAQGPANLHIDGIYDSNFTGASGTIQFDRNARAITGILLGLYNIRPVEASPGNHTYQAVLVKTWTSADGWQPFNGESIRYRDGSTVEPNGKREALNNNYLPKSVRGIGLGLFGLAQLIGFASMAAVWKLRKDATIQRTQPFFMLLLCFGSVIMSISIFTLSWDEGAGWSDQQLDVACTLTPWFFFMGQIMTFRSCSPSCGELTRCCNFVAVR